MWLITKKQLSRYVKHVFDDFEQDKNVNRALRRLRIKEVHLKRRKQCKELMLLQKTRRLMW